ncbi:MAG: TonB-dependent receptor [Candidatus Thiodiazotropha sp.]
MTFSITSVPRGGTFTVFAVALWLTGGVTQALFAGECETPVAQAVSIQGRVELHAADASGWTAIRQDEWLCPGDRIRVGANSRAGLTLHNETLLRLDEHTSVTINAPAEDGTSWLDLLQGVTHFISRIKHSFRVQTPYVNASIEGTEFVVSANADEARITVIEGHVLAQNTQGELMLGPGEQAVSVKDGAPRSALVVSPYDAVKWALYYPLVFDPYRMEWQGNTAAVEALRHAQRLLKEGDTTAALSQLESLSDEARNTDTRLYHAALLLSVGRVDEASAAIAQALKQAPDNAQALALQSVIALATGDRQRATELADEAVRLDAQSVAPLMARSYAQQASFDLDAAFASARQATEAAPTDALSKARLAELELAQGRLREAIEAASAAVEVNPDFALPRTVLGFSHLSRFEIENARSSFEQAISLDPADPLPRLGLGLAKIRKGDVEGGRRDLEIAASLDPNNSMVRSYLGKAYYEEKRDPLAASQLAMAKELDPNDPTPWYYDALLKQSDNRPVEALEDVQTSINLNDNRAVYRSRFLLDRDEAARNASQARIYQDLGFDRLALNEGYSSLQISPGTHSAHRMLSDSYSGKPRYENARVSELLQSQLLQPLNTTPIQPQLAASNLGILDGAGPSSGGHSEYTPLFTRNDFNIQFNAIGGTNSTGGDDLVVSGLHDRISYSLGQFHYETDGWRDNNDLKQDIYNAFLQASLSPDTSIQFEYRSQESESGDLAFVFDPMDFSPFVRREVESSLGRIGIHHQPAPGTDLLASFIYQDLKQVQSENFTQFIPAIDTQSPYGILPGVREVARATTSDSIARTGELQWIQHISDHVFTLGAGYHDEDRSDRYDSLQTLTIELPGPPFIFFDSLDQSIAPVEIDPSYKNAYLYSLLQLPHGFNLTLGAAYADFESSAVEVDAVDPKVGLTWEASDNVVLRATYLESLARPSNMDRSIEPTQVAGFNQLYDEVPGAETEHYGLGIDIKPSRSLSIGAEFNRRDIKAPITALSANSNSVPEERDEKRYLAYLYWTPIHNLGISLAYENEQFKRDLFSPESLDTQRLPVGVSYFWQSGFYLQTVGTYIDQEIKQSGTVEQEDFWNLDAVVGYRFPKRWGKAEIIVKNMLDKEFRYYDLSFQTGEPLPPQYQPEQQIFARLTIDF